MVHHIENIYDFLSQPYPPNHPYFVLILGNSDLRVPKFAAKYCLDNSIKPIIITGGFGKVTKDLWKISEAKMFAKIMIDNGTNPDYLFLEEDATNTGENIAKSKALIQNNNIPHEKGLLISKPYMTRRAYNTASKKWDTVKWASLGEPLTSHQYFNKVNNQKEFINLLVSDLQRIKIYGENGFQIEDEIPTSVWQSFENLVKSGYNKFIIK